jgi:hypothetical protein
VGLALSAAVMMGGAAAASAATSAPVTHSFPGPGCNPWAPEHWNLNGSNTVKATYLGGNFTYSVTFKQTGSCLSGTLTDSLFPTTGPIRGTVNKNYITFSFRYPSSGSQGTRTFHGTINKWGAVGGYWSETGTEHGSGTWTLAKKAGLACPWAWWNPRAACFVFPHH